VKLGWSRYFLDALLCGSVLPPFLSLWFIISHSCYVINELFWDGMMKCMVEAIRRGQKIMKNDNS
jgi:hypothetical protein